MSLYEKLNNRPAQPDIGSMYQSFRSNPIQFLLMSKLNIPQGMTNPQQIVQHLAQTGQIPARYQNEINRMLYR